VKLKAVRGVNEVIDQRSTMETEITGGGILGFDAKLQERIQPPAVDASGIMVWLSLTEVPPSTEAIFPRVVIGLA
jgi:hypothetical protein